MSDKCKHGIRDTETNLPYCRRCDQEAASELAAPSGSAIRAQSVAEIPDSPTDTQKWALRIISLSQRDNFQDDYDWAKWCRAVAGAGLMKDGDKLERLEQVVWRISPNDKGQR